MQELNLAEDYSEKEENLVKIEDDINLDLDVNIYE